MGKVRARKETGKLYLDFMYQGVRCREQTALTETVANRKNVENLMMHIEAKILLGEFDYAKQFPNSRNLKTIAGQKITSHSVNKNSLIQAPLFADFADQWFSEMRIGNPP